MYVNLVFSHWYSNWATGSMSTSDVRLSVTDLLREPPAYTFWTDRRHSWLTSGNPNHEKFGRMVDESYGTTETPMIPVRQSLTAPITEDPARHPPNNLRTPRVVEALVLGASAGAAWTVIRRILVQRRQF